MAFLKLLSSNVSDCNAHQSQPAWPAVRIAARQRWGASGLMAQMQLSRPICLAHRPNSSHNLHLCTMLECFCLLLNSHNVPLNSPDLSGTPWIHRSCLCFCLNSGMSHFCLLTSTASFRAASAKASTAAAHLQVGTAQKRAYHICWLQQGRIGCEKAYGQGLATTGVEKERQPAKVRWWRLGMATA